MTRDPMIGLAWLSRPRNYWVIIGTILGTLPIVIAFVMMRRHWTSVPYYDDWYTPGAQIVSFSRGVLCASDLWSQHNESRPLFPRLLCLALTSLFSRWNVKDEMLLTFAFVCAASLTLYHLLRLTTDFTIRERLFAWALLNSLLFCPGQYVNFLWGIELTSVVPGSV